MITSPRHPEVKAVAALHKRAERERTGLFLIEGRPEIQRAAAAGIQVTTVYRLIGSDVITLPNNPRIVEIGAAAFEKIAYGRDGIVATAVSPGFNIEALAINDPALVLVIESIEKPGNLGAILRSADGAGASVIVTDTSTDLVNPNVVRASVGTLFTVPVAIATSAEAVDYLKRRSIAICIAITGSGTAPWDLDLTGPIAIIIGSEHAGLSPLWRQAADRSTTLPLSGSADSLNASVAAAVLLFEAVRQRSPAR